MEQCMRDAYEITFYGYTDVDKKRELKKKLVVIIIIVIHDVGWFMQSNRFWKFSRNLTQNCIISLSVFHTFFSIKLWISEHQFVENPKHKAHTHIKLNTEFNSSNVKSITIHLIENPVHWKSTWLQYRLNCKSNDILNWFNFFRSFFHRVVFFFIVQPIQMNVQWIYVTNVLTSIQSHMTFILLTIDCILGIANCDPYTAQYPNEWK